MEAACELQMMGSGYHVHWMADGLRMVMSLDSVNHILMSFEHLGLSQAAKNDWLILHTLLYLQIAQKQMMVDRQTLLMNLADLLEAYERPRLGDVLFASLTVLPWRCCESHVHWEASSP